MVLIELGWIGVAPSEFNILGYCCVISISDKNHPIALLVVN